MAPCHAVAAARHRRRVDRRLCRSRACRETLDETEATAAPNLGSITLDAKRLPVLDSNGEPELVQGLADAAVNKARGVVVTSTVNAAD